MVKKFTIPFASQGDANDIPDALQVDGKVSFTQGFGYDYERPYDDPQAKDIAREDMNGIFKSITSAVGELQTLGASEWSSAISYPKGAIVYFEKDLYISQVDDNQNTPPQNWVSITSIANDSLKKAANLSDLTNKTTARSNLGLGSSATLNKTDTLGTSTSLVATQKLVNDTKINLESSKQDKLTFTGTGNVARMSEVEKKRDIDDGTFNKSVRVTSNDNYPRLTLESNTEAVLFEKAEDSGAAYFTLRRIADGSNIAIINLPRKSGTLALKSELPAISQSLGYSTTSVMSQKAVTDQLNSIKSEHGLGYGQEWVDVMSQRSSGATYTNNTGKPISASIVLALGASKTAVQLGRFLVDGVTVVGTTKLVEGFSYQISCVIPHGSSYVLHKDSRDVVSWAELR